jgi:glycosyltransferase involved in cell wall biosynthesis
MMVQGDTPPATDGSGQRSPASGEQSNGRPLLIDASRLIWRAWSGRHPTGIDRVCLAYLEHFGDRAQAVVQRRGNLFVLSPDHSDRLFQLLRRGGSRFRRDILKLGFSAWRHASRRPPKRGLIYLNVGHTGLENPALLSWIRKNQLRAVYLVHDIIPISHPQFCRPGEREKHVGRMTNVLTSARAIIGNSQATLDEMADFAASQGLAMPQSVAAWISGSPKPAAIAPSPIQEPYFVTLGTIEGRKNHLLLLDVWQSLIDELGSDAPKLVIIGQRGWQADQVFEMLDGTPALRSHVTELNSCGDGEVASLLSGARALLMPSFAEGFGLPVIEALQLGTPVIASDLQVYREIVGDIPTYVDPRDQDAWTKAVTRFVGDDEERERQLVAMANYRSPDWAQHFTILEQFLRTL